MECVNCYELFDEGLHLPVNLDCGHTFCRMCVTELVRQKAKLPHCPMCRAPIPAPLGSEAFPRNFAALELSAALREKRNLYEFCATHALEPERFFCTSCQRGVCASCLVEHSKHTLAPQEFSHKVVWERMAALRKWAEDETRNLGLRLLHSRERLAQVRVAEALEEGRLAESARALRDKLLQDIEDVKAHHRQHVAARQAELRASSKSLGDQLAELALASAQLEELEAQLQKGGSCARELGLVEKVEEIETRTLARLAELPGKQAGCAESLRISLNPKFEEGLGRLGSITAETADCSVVFIGEQNTCFLYHVESNEWRLLRLSAEPGLEPSPFCTAHALTDRLLLFGGGQSAEVLQLEYKTLALTRAGTLAQSRTEHCSVRVDSRVYLLGGYNKETNQFLADCEVFSIKDGASRPVQPMRTAKCGFAAAALPGHILVAGGFDGSQRLRAVEKYALAEDCWSALRVALPLRLAYHALVAIGDGKLLLIGGSSAEEEYSRAVYQLDPAQESCAKYGHVPEGRDTRHKVVLHEDRLLVFGGGDSPSYAYSYFEDKWTELAGLERGAVGESFDSWVAVAVANFPRPTGRAAHCLFENEQFGASNLIGFDDSLSSV